MEKVDCVLSILLLLAFNDVLGSNDGEVEVIADIVHTMKSPSVIFSTLCWTNSRKLQLYLTLTNTKRTPVSSVQFVKAGQSVPNSIPYQNVLFLADLTCPKAEEHLTKSYAKNYFRSPFRWILIHDFSNGNETAKETETVIPDAVKNIQILPDAEVVIAKPLWNGSYSLDYIYRIVTDGPWQTEPYGIWDPINRFQEATKVWESTAMRRINLHRHEIAVVHVLTDNDSLNTLTNRKNGHIDTISKVNFESVNHLLDLLNATRRYIFVNTWGYETNGSWDGLTGYLARGEAEIGGTPMFFTAARLKVLEYISCPIQTKTKFVFLQPKLSYTNNLFLLSFDTAVWYSLLGLVFLMFAALLAVSHWEWKRYKQNTQTSKDATILRGNVQDVALLVLGAACQQGSPFQLKGTLGRIVMLILFVTLMFLHTSYSANIVALLQSSSSQIKTLEDLLHSRLKFGVQDIVYNKYYFPIQTEPIRKALYKTKIAPGGSQPRYMSMEEGVKNIRKGLFAFNMETGVGYKFVGKFFTEGEKCGLQEIEYLQMINPWQAVRKYTPYKEMIKIGFKRIQEHGLQKRQNELLYEKKPKCSGRESHFVSVSMVDCYPALLVLGYGIIVALFFLTMEILMKKRQQLMNRICSKINTSN